MLFGVDMSDEFRRHRKTRKCSHVNSLRGWGTWIRTKIDGSESAVLLLNKKLLLYAEGNLTGVAYAELPAKA
jgi:hypothetical protein